MGRRLSPSARLCTLTGGDDYELVFTAPPAHEGRVAALAAELGLPLTCIGRIDAEPGLRLLDGRGQAVSHDVASFDHFKSD
jgi:thiamine-monophosphate kinase